jgi:hypothetical protein
MDDESTGCREGGRERTKLPPSLRPPADHERLFSGKGSIGVLELHKERHEPNEFSFEIRILLLCNVRPQLSSARCSKLC